MAIALKHGEKKEQKDVWMLLTTAEIAVIIMESVEIVSLKGVMSVPMGCNYCDYSRQNVSGEGERSRYEYVYQCAIHNHDVCPSKGDVLSCIYQKDIMANPPLRYFKYVSGYKINDNGYECWEDNYESWRCGMCYLPVDEKDNFCRHCGWQLKEVDK